MVRISRQEATADEGGGCRVVLEGSLDRFTVPTVESELRRMVETLGSGTLTLELGGVERMDSAGAAALAEIFDLARARRARVRFGTLSAAAQDGLTLFSIKEAAAVAEAKPREPLAVRVGEAAWARWQNFYMFLSLTADTLIWSFFGGERRTGRVRRGAVWTEANRLGVDSLNIVGLIAFLVGTVVALQSAYQLRQFGADIFVANLIGVSMTREMGPLMTAIILAGRSGAAIAAEIATMSVNEEVAALRTLGLKPIRYIVVPKFQAISITMIGLTTFANLLGIFGGFLVAVLYMDLGVMAFLGQLIDSLVMKDLLTGLVKSIAFAWIIVLIAAHNGFQAYGGAESVGQVTTSSVVSSIFWVIVADAGFNMLFYFGG